MLREQQRLLPQHQAHAAPAGGWGWGWGGRRSQVSAVQLVRHGSLSCGSCGGSGGRQGAQPWTAGRSLSCSNTKARRLCLPAQPRQHQVVHRWWVGGHSTHPNPPHMNFFVKNRKKKNNKANPHIRFASVRSCLPVNRYSSAPSCTAAPAQYSTVQYEKCRAGERSGRGKGAAELGAVAPAQEGQGG